MKCSYNFRNVFRFPFSILNYRGGYVAITTGLIISAIIILIVATLSQTSFLGRAGIAGTQFKESSRFLAEACTNTALLKLVDDPLYAGGETITVGSSTCDIISVISTSTGRIISARGIFQKSYTNYKVTVASNTVDVVGREEVKSF